MTESPTEAEEPPGEEPASEPSTHRRHQKRRRRWLVLAGVVGALVVVAGLAATFGLRWYLDRELDRVPRFELAGAPLERPTPDEAEHYLVAGIDGIADDGATGPLGALLLVRVDQDRGAERPISLLSVPRELSLVPDRGGRDALTVGTIHAGLGRETLIRTVTERLGVPVHHYVEVDLAGVERLLDEIDPPQVAFTEPIDADGVVVPAGCGPLDGATAHTLLTAAEVRLDRGAVDPEVALQVRAAVFSAVAVAALDESYGVSDFNWLVDLAQDHLVVDENLSNSVLLSLGRWASEEGVDGLYDGTFPYEVAADLEGAPTPGPQVVLASEAVERLSAWQTAPAADLVVATPDDPRGGGHGPLAVPARPPLTVGVAHRCG